MNYLYSRSIPARWIQVPRRAALLALLGAGTFLSAQPSDLELAYASRIAYSGRFADIVAWEKDPAKFLKGYKLMDWVEDNTEQGRELVDFRAIALRNEATHTVIIAYRGTDPALARNIAVDGGMFLTIAGKRPAVVIGAHMEMMGDHYGGVKGAAISTAGLALAEAVPESETGGAWLHKSFKVGLTLLGMPYRPDRDLRTLTSISCDHAIEFFQKTRQKLIEEAGESKASLVTKLAIRQGWSADPNVLHPGGYTIYLTGHSLGGFLAQIVGATQGANTITFAAPGVQEYLAARKLPTVDLAPFTVRQVIREHDVVGSFGTHVGLSELLCDFYDSPVERERLEAAVAAADRDLQPQRAAWLAQKQEAYRAQLSAYQAELASLPARLAEYNKKVAQREAELKKMGWAEWASERAKDAWKGGPIPPTAPVPPVAPTVQEAQEAFPNPYLAEGNTPQGWAKVDRNGVIGYFYTNHSLEGIIHQLEWEQNLALTEPYPHAAAPAEENKTQPTALPAVRIEASTQELAPGEDMIVHAVAAPGRNPGWTWKATAGAIVDVGDGNAHFTAPIDQPEGTVITITATEASSSSTSAPGQAIWRVQVKRSFIERGPDAAPLPEASKSIAAQAPARQDPEIRILSRSQEIVPGGTMNVFAVDLSGRISAWTWTASSGRIETTSFVNLATFTAPADAAEGTVIRITAQEVSSSSQSAPRQGVLEVRVHRP
jgi:hypothetical protein